jgi:hypothetical protein
MEANLLAADVPIRLAKIRLRMTWTMAQWHEHLPRPQHLRRYILTHDRVATAKALFVPQPLENPMRRVTLFLVNAAVAFKNGVNPRHKWSKLPGRRPLAPPIARRNGKTQHLRDRVPTYFDMLFQADPNGSLTAAALARKQAEGEAREQAI